jgi:chromosome segregation ATPase
MAESVHSTALDAVRPPLRSFSSSNGSNGREVDSLLAIVLKDLEGRVTEWSSKVEAEKGTLQKEWSAIEQERAKLRARTKAVEDSAKEVAGVMAEVQRLREELEKRLVVTPMDLNASQLQEEWRRIDMEKASMRKAAEELQSAMDRLADAQAAHDLLQ